GNNGGFMVIASDGRLIVNNTDSIDFETKTQFSLDIEITDLLNNKDTTTITINVINVNESVYAGFGGTLEFDGSSHVDLGANPSFNLSNDFTIETWIKTTDNVGSSIFTYGSSVTSNWEGYQIMLNGSGKVWISSIDQPSNTLSIFSNQSVNDGN